ncbi:Uncharacterised protein [Vibrio cholerae]|nr:Uncharacterised protein [Vibrio cholerae]
MTKRVKRPCFSMREPSTFSSLNMRFFRLKKSDFNDSL